MRLMWYSEGIVELILCLSAYSTVPLFLYLQRIIPTLGFHGVFEIMIQGLQIILSCEVSYKHFVYGTFCKILVLCRTRCGESSSNPIP